MGQRALLLLVALAATAPAAAAGSSSPPPVPTETKVVSTGAGPCGATAKHGALWVGVYAGTLLRVDGQGLVTRRIAVGESACRVAVDARFVWVTRDGANEVVRLTSSTGRLDRVGVGAVPFDVLRANGFVWVTNWKDGTLTKIDPESRAPLSTTLVGAYPTGLAQCGGRIWIGHGRSARRITAIDRTSLRVQQVAVGATPEWPHCIRGVVWVTTPDSVLRLDARTGRVLSRLELGETLADAAAAPDGLVWVTDKEHSLVRRVSSDGRSLVDSFPAGPGAFALARVGNSMWVTSFAGADVRRFDP
jgi:DNA-binding beta-propeller fold protein YncE